MPVPAQVGGVVGDDDEVADAGLDDLVAAGTQVALGGLVRLDPPDVDLVYLGNAAHNTRRAMTARPAAT